jgi:hypothetical protein
MNDTEFDVTLTLTIGTNIIFDGAVTPDPSEHDAVQNGIGCIPQEVFDLLEGEGFGIAYPIGGSAERV